MRWPGAARPTNAVRMLCGVARAAAGARPRLPDQRHRLGPANTAPAPPLHWLLPLRPHLHSPTAPTSHTSLLRPLRPQAYQELQTTDKAKDMREQQLLRSQMELAYKTGDRKTVRCSSLCCAR